MLGTTFGKLGTIIVRFCIRDDFKCGYVWHVFVRRIRAHICSMRERQDIGLSKLAIERNHMRSFQFCCFAKAALGRRENRYSAPFLRKSPGSSQTFCSDPGTVHNRAGYAERATHLEPAAAVTRKTPINTCRLPLGPGALAA